MPKCNRYARLFGTNVIVFNRCASRPPYASARLIAGRAIAPHIALQRDNGLFAGIVREIRDHDHICLSSLF